MKDLQEILAIARGVGKEAAVLLRSYYQGTADQNLDVKYKENEPVTAADIAVNQLILEKLQAALGNEDFLYVSEETYKSELVKHKSSQWVWIIDPLDGTRDFIEKTGEYAIHIALVQETRPVLAVVAVPESEKLYYAIKGNGAFVETSEGVVPLQVSSQKHIEDLTVVVSRTHRNKTLDFLLEQLPCKNQKAIGSVGCKIATIVEQQADVYISLSGKSAPKDWDIAAPELILTEAGGKFTHFDGTPLRYNTGDINQWGGLLASNGQFHELLCQQAQKIIETQLP
ncbi:3'(2'),5'-bisphosphate nucleotidase CysQ [Aetokthonos hydrillicola Thurmond2011]|jgi:3'(2'), 5'-bisphosphate nucleotidase|uniref:inositol-phosphate phosphatase n=1 Tax=Aetokthonos hydrillicola Thurmond2011 TaxID=2712845 RepID=A0AAP5I9P7_9CYAN|nr:3'(2'),5'-bisphosphate nucleotidase CysQ [Aetokthonos hydrillicola]MBW4585836.1 3'(2'),5'-bisphosphate nucleotidase CysQ [Aetokthonos hydrillicola CCALA 1050]MDR9895020.1 3'(2'),5'-bisphosphate nucleotidase CysQ [Aetokthonos hydrillicola Thurmond2011]